MPPTRSVVLCCCVAQELIESIRQLRHQCVHALHWGSALRVRAAKTEDAKAADLLSLSARLIERARLEEQVRCGKLPAVDAAAVDDAERLVAMLKDMGTKMGALEAAVKTLPTPSGSARGRAGESSSASGTDGAAGYRSMLYAMLRHADSASAKAALAVALAAARQLATLGTSVASAGHIGIPAVLKKMVDDAVDDASTQAAVDGSADFDLTKLHCEALAEVAWRAHPERRGIRKAVARKIYGDPGGDALRTVLTLICVEGKPPVTARDWVVVEQVA